MKALIVKILEKQGDPSNLYNKGKVYQNPRKGIQRKTEPTNVLIDEI